MRPRVTVVVVTYNSGEEALTALRSARASTIPARLVVVDNASADDTADLVERAFPDAVVIRNERNLGFGAGVNVGARLADTEFLFFLNPDARLDPKALEILVAALDERLRAAVVGPLVRNPDGSIQPSRRALPDVRQAALHGLVGLVWPGNPGSKRYLLAGVRTDEPRPVGWVSGNSMLVRRAAFEAAGGFDEAFFFFVEDVDLCKRLTDAGWTIWFQPRAEVVHAWGTSWTKRPLKFLWLHHRNLIRYALKHNPDASPAWKTVVVGGAVARFAILAARVIVTRRAVPPHAGG